MAHDGEARRVLYFGPTGEGIKQRPCGSPTRAHTQLVVTPSVLDEISHFCCLPTEPKPLRRTIIVICNWLKTTESPLSCASFTTHRLRLRHSPTPLTSPLRHTPVGSCLDADCTPCNLSTCTLDSSLSSALPAHLSSCISDLAASCIG